MKFRVGDLCEVISVSRAAHNRFIGAELVLVKLTDGINSDGSNYHGWRTDPALLNINGMKIIWEEHELRLKRPPSWNSWIFDTSDISREKREEERV